jgi:hypothetical protein
MARNVAVVTTTHKDGWDLYGARMAASFDRHWPESVPLLLYKEGFSPPPDMPRLVCRDLLDSCPELAAFKARHAANALANGRSWMPRPRLVNTHLIGKPRRRFRLFRRGYRWDAVRFAHKMFAIFHAAATTDADLLIWIDADTLFFADVPPEEFDDFCPPDCFVGCLRRRTHTETGFVAYNLRHDATARMLDAFRRMYTDDLLFAEAEFHDAFIFDMVRIRTEVEGHHSHDIAEGIGMCASHVLINSRLGRFMDHMKGARKIASRSSAKDLVVARSESYWTQK